MSRQFDTDNHAAFDVAVSINQSRHEVDQRRLIEAALAILRDSTFSTASISLAVVDDETIHELNRRHLNHDWPTDVLSFVLDDAGDHLEGEIILSADTASSVAEELGVPAADEQLLYVIHGMLHLIGYDDRSDEDAVEMRAAEVKYLSRFGVELPQRAEP
jgi:probable rRNA maturation factor